MNVLSLFSGIGGLDLGLERAGMTIVGQVEIDPWCRQILAKHWPEVPRHDDVRTCVEWWRSESRPVVDLICGGVPCQPVSLAGLGLAQDDPRWLWPATIDAIGALRPGYALLENVPGLLARGMGDVLGHLAEVGYDAEWDCVPASAVGAPHRRDRVWIVAYPQGDGRGHGRSWRPAGAGAQRQGLAAQELADPSGERRGEGPGQFGRMGTAGCGQELANSDSRRLEVCAQLDSQAQQNPADRHPRRGHPDGRSHQVANTHREPLGWPAISRRQCDHWVTEPDVGRVAHGIPRRVDRLRGLGNAVVPQVAEHVGRLIMAADAEQMAS